LQGSLFGDRTGPQDQSGQKSVIDLQPGTLSIYESFLPESMAAELLDGLSTQLNWTQPLIRMHGKLIRVPRLQVWMGDANSSYAYSNQMFKPEPWHPDIIEVRERITAAIDQCFNSVLCNLYRNGQDSVDWHADDEPELDTHTVIASYSLGAHRSFQLKPKHDRASKLRHRFSLPHNSLLVMSPSVQQAWLHQVPKTKKIAKPRINLTFRTINKLEC
jgi:alkylated DNA repair dioxygenase AlkB